MALINSDVIPASATGGYTIDQSLRFNDDDTAYLSRTPSSAGNRRTWTWSGWVKRGNLGSFQALFASHSALSNAGFMYAAFNSSDTFQLSIYTTTLATTSQVFRDTSAWYHLIVSFDATAATASDRLKIYVNGEEASLSTDNRSSISNTDYAWNQADKHFISGRYVSGWGSPIDGYLAEVHNIDGTALDPTYFGETGDYGEWKPIEYTGTYGTNGFYLDFDSTYYNDKSGNGNNFTASNLATTDVVLDSPTNNFATFNPIHDDGNIDSNFYEGNLKFMNPSTNSVTPITATIGAKTGKWYAEFYLVQGDGGWGSEVGVIPTNFEFQSGVDINYQGGVEIRFRSSDMDIYNNTTQTQSNIGSTSNGDIIGVALDLDGGTVQFYQNGSAKGTSESLPSTTDSTRSGGYWTFAVMDYVSSNGKIANFGQDSSFAGNKTAQGNTDANGYGDFYYTPPSGYLALCTANLPDPAVIPSEHFNTLLYTGNGTTSRSITGVGFQPDFVWGKERNAGSHHVLVDAVRGLSTGGRLSSNRTNAEDNLSNATLDSFDSDGFTTGSSTNLFNTNTYSFVTWNWKAGNGTSSNTNGDITSTVSANQDAGFSIVSYTGTGSNATVGHGLNSAPEMVIVKSRSDAIGWLVYHAGVASDAETDYLVLNQTDAAADFATVWNDTAPTSSVFSLGSSSAVNTSGATFISYCFHSVDGFSKVGSYTGNGSTDGTFVYTGFRPAFLMVKRADSANDWIVNDRTRTPYNEITGSSSTLYANTSGQESNYNTNLDFTSNGFKARTTGGHRNASGGTYIYIAFAENPFKYTNAR